MFIVLRYSILERSKMFVGFLCFYFVIDILIASALAEVSAKNEFSATIYRSKRQDDRWNWGFINLQANTSTTPGQNDNQMSSSPTTTSMTPITEVNPCENPYKPQAKDFRRPGRRISEVKCYEYISLLKDRIEIVKSDEACLQWRKAHGEFAIGAIGGHDTEEGDFPHMGAIGWKDAQGGWVFNCGASLISSRFMLTAAHCSRASERDTTLAEFDPKIVRLGTKKIVEGNSISLPDDVDISRFVVHPQYKPPKAYNDIAIIELAKSVNFTKLIHPACLWRTYDTSSMGKKATVTGWGYTETFNHKKSQELQAADVEVIDATTCGNLLQEHCNRNWCGLQDTQLCAGNLSGGVDACQGDSGGPLQMKIPLPDTSEGSMHYVIGVTAFGFGCARANTPGVYTRVSAFIDWIEGMVWS